MITSRDILLGLLLPGVATATLVLLTARWCGCAFGLAAGYALGHALIGGWPGWPPLTTEQWLVYLALLAAGADWVERRSHKALLQWGIRTVLVGLLLGLTLRPLIQQSWTVGQSFGWTAGSAVVLLALWRLSKRGGASEKPMVLLLSWILVVGATGMVCAMSGSQKLGQFGGTLTAALIGCALVAVWKPEAALDCGGWAVTVVVWIGLLLNGHFYASVPWWAGLLLGLAPLGMWIGTFLRAGSWKPWQKTALILGAVSVPLMAAMIPITVRFLRAMSAAPGSADYY
ncbi:MAG: hypothetical protein HY735_13590 [Verrucomicrobia bacterium]|nr:hypothetical protein [Verrucomicrobiota bacterium]